MFRAMICVLLLVVTWATGCQRQGTAPMPAERDARAEPNKPLPSVRRAPQVPRAAPPVLSVHKCASPEGSIAYQDTPCDGGSREIAHHVERVAPKASRATIVARAEREASHLAAIAHGSARRGSAGWNAANARVAERRRYCEQTRLEVQRERDRNWMRLTVDYLRALDERVRRACET